MSNCIVPTAEITDNDVLLGRGKAIHSHEGNIRFRKLVQEHVAAGYSPLSREGKAKRSQETAADIIETIRGKGGRFLKARPSVQPSGATGACAALQKWDTVSIVVTTGKVRQALRDAKSKGERETNRRQRGGMGPAPRTQSVAATGAIRSDGRGASENTSFETRSNSLLESQRRHREEQQSTQLMALLLVQQRVRRLDHNRRVGELLLAARASRLNQEMSLLPVDTHSRILERVERPYTTLLPQWLADFPSIGSGQPAEHDNSVIPHASLRSFDQLRHLAGNSSQLH